MMTPSFVPPMLATLVGGPLDALSAVVDGEVIALDDHGEPDFALLYKGLELEKNARTVIRERPKAPV